MGDPRRDPLPLGSLSLSPLAEPGAPETPMSADSKPQRTANHPQFYPILAWGERGKQSLGRILPKLAKSRAQEPI